MAHDNDERFAQLNPSLLGSVFSFFPVLQKQIFHCVNRHWRQAGTQHDENHLKQLLNQTVLNSHERETLLFLMKLYVKRHGSESLAPLLQRYQNNSRHWDIHPLEREKAELLLEAMQNPSKLMKQLRAGSVSLPYALGRTSSLTFYPTLPFARPVDCFYDVYAETRPPVEKRRRTEVSRDSTEESPSPTQPMSL